MTKVLLYELGQSISFGRLSLLAKVLWPMLLASSDDQGRGLAEPDAIKWHVCPNVAELTIENIPGILVEMENQEMLCLYPDGRDRSVYQIVRWWEFQQLQYAQPSRFQPPDGWTDRLRYTVRGEGQTKENWDHPGGFADAPPCESVNEPAAIPPGNPPGNLGENPPGLPNQQNLNQFKSKEDQSTATSTNASAAKPLPAAAAADDAYSLLIAEGIDETIARELSDRSVIDVRGWIAEARASPRLKNPKGLIVKRVRDRVPAPLPRNKDPGPDRRRYIEGEFAEFIEH